MRVVGSGSCASRPCAAVWALATLRSVGAALRSVALAVGGRGVGLVDPGDVRTGAAGHVVGRGLGATLDLDHVAAPAGVDANAADVRERGVVPRAAVERHRAARLGDDQHVGARLAGEPDLAAAQRRD